MQNVVERVINLLIYLLDSPNPVTAEQVRQTVAGYGEQSDEAFHRMFERDKDLLKRMGVPLELKATDKWEIDFGYTVDPDKYAIPDPRLTEQERVALSVAARMVRLGGANAGLAGLLKLGGVEVGAGIEPLAADLGAEAALLGDLYLAVSERRRLDGERVYRVDRVSGLEVGREAGAFERPKRFQVKRAMSMHPWEAGTDEAVEATVRFDPEVAWWAARHLGVEGPDDGPLEIELQVANRDAFIGWVLGFGPDAEVLGPAELRQQVLARIEAAVGAAQ